MDVVGTWKLVEQIKFYISMPISNRIEIGVQKIQGWFQFCDMWIINEIGNAKKYLIYPITPIDCVQ